MVKCALTNVWWDSSYIDIPYFNTDEERNSFFSLPAVLGVSVNFNYSSPLTAEANFNTGVLTLSNVHNNNYFIVDDGENYLFFFVKSSLYNAAFQVKLELELDIFTTYFNSVSFANTIVNRSHLDRFVYRYNRFEFKYGATSDLYISDNFKNHAKYLKNTTKVSWEMGDEAISKWFYDNIIGYEYVFFSQGDVVLVRDQRVTLTTANSVHYDINYSSVYTADYRLFCVPIYSGDYRIQVKTGTEIVNIEQNGLEGLFTLNDAKSKVYSIKYSCYPPFVPRSGIGFSITETGDLLVTDTIDNQIIWDTKAGVMFGRTSNRPGTDILTGVAIIEYQDLIVNYTPALNSILYDTPGYPTFTKEQLKGAYDYKMCPKYIDSNYNELIISFSDGSQYKIDLNKYAGNSIRFYYVEPLVPDLTRAYFQVVMTEANPPSGQIYNKESIVNYNGKVLVSDFSVPYSLDQLTTLLANQKNFILAYNYNTEASKDIRDFGAIGGALTGMISSISYGGVNYAGPAVVTGLSKMAVELESSSMIAEQRNANLQYSLDNMRNAPETLSNAKGNPLLNISIAELFPHLNLFTALETEIKNEMDYYHMFGYPYMKIGNIKSFLNTRKYFNYISANVDSMTRVGGISDRVRLMFKKLLRRGVRFWNVLNGPENSPIDYSKENYEKSLENVV